MFSSTLRQEVAEKNPDLVERSVQMEASPCITAPPQEHVSARNDMEPNPLALLEEFHDKHSNG